MLMKDPRTGERDERLDQMTTRTMMRSLVALLLASGAFAQGDGPVSETPGPIEMPAATELPPPPPPDAGPGAGAPGERRGRRGPGPRLTEAEKQQLQGMTEEQRKAFFAAKRQAFLDSLTPEQRAQMEARRKEHEARLQSMTPEQREAMKARRGGRRGPRSK